MFKALNIVSYCASLPVLVVWTILLVKIHLLGEQLRCLVAICILLILAQVSSMAVQKLQLAWCQNYIEDSSYKGITNTQFTNLASAIT